MHDIPHSASRRPHAPTLNDVAAAAGVSVATASRALTKPERVNVDTLYAVRQAAEELGYQAKHAQNRLPHDDMHGLIAVVVSDLGNPVYAEFVKHIQQESMRSGFGVLVVDAQEAGVIERNTLTLVRKQVDGIILSSSRLSDRMIQELMNTKPVVAINRSIRGVKSVIADTFSGMEATMQYLSDLGHHSLTYLAGPTDSWQDVARWNALLTLCNRHEFTMHRIACNAPTYDGGYRALSEFLRHPTTAVIAYNDILAIGFLEALKKSEIIVPDQVSVIGIDNIPISGRISPSLTTIAIDREDIGTVAAQELISRVQHRHMEETLSPIMRQAHLVIRESTGPATTSPLAPDTVHE